MSNYRRLISYIYAYEGGVKGKNIGFVKIEIRGDQCRIYVNVKKIYVGSNDIGVYLLSPGAEILLGRIFIRGGAGEFRMSVSSSDVEGSGCSMEECYGLTVHDVESTWQCYTTIWEDAVAQAAETMLAGVTAERVRERQEQEKNQQCPAKIPMSEEEAPRFPISDEIEQELKREEEQQEAVIPWEEERKQEADLTDRDVISDGKACKKLDENPDGQMCQNTVEKSTETMDISPSEKSDRIAVQISEDREKEQSEPEDIAKLQELDRQEQEERKKNHLWNQLQCRYTKVLAFDYDNGCEILSIKPQDIGLLPREIWVFGNNSFLLHGYYNYRHLILAKLNNPKGNPRYLLGVPGHYFSNEKYMASMFGFPHFVLARKQPEQDGRFGYWYTDIRL